MKIRFFFSKYLGPVILILIIIMAPSILSLNSQAKTELDIIDVIGDTLVLLTSFIWLIVIQRLYSAKNIYTPLFIGFLLVFMGFYESLLNEFFAYDYYLFGLKHTFVSYFGLVVSGFGMFNWVKSYRISEENVNKLNIELQNYINMLSHDLKTPVVSIKGFVALLKKNNVDFGAKANHYLNRIDMNANFMQKLILNILSYSSENSSKTSKGERKSDNFDSAIILREINEEFSFLLTENSINFVIEEPKKFPNLKFDVIKFRQILSNLVSNAIKYMGDKGTEIIIRYEYLKDSKENQFQVFDNGQGIEDKYHLKIFEPFIMIDNADKINNESTGLGLAIVKRILTSYQGRIWVKSQVGVGSFSSFFFTIPS